MRHTVRIATFLFAVSLFLAYPPFAVADLLDATAVDPITQAFIPASGTAAIGGTFTVVGNDPKGTGTGSFVPFVRLQEPNGQTIFEQGYNTDLPSSNNPPFDAKPGTWTHPLLLSDVPIVSRSGVTYYEFRLDANQTNNGPISLNQIQIFQANGDHQYTGITDATSTTPPLIAFSDLTEVFRMNNAVSTFYTVKVAGNSGSGSGDMILYVPTTGWDTLKTNVIFYSEFGIPPGGLEANDGFEEWGLINAGVWVPDGGLTLMLLGGALVGLEVLRRRSRV